MVLVQLTLEGKVVDLEALVRALVSRHHRGVADQGVVDTRVRDQVGLELVQIHVEGTIETEGRGDGADNLSNQAVQVLVVGTGNVQVSLADIVDSLVVDQEGTVRVLDGAVSGQDGVVGLDNGSRDTGGRVDGELQLALLAVLGRQTLEKESTETGTSTTTKGVEDQETLQSTAVVGDAADTVHDIIDHLLSNGVVTTGIVVGGILLATDQELGVEERLVVTSSDLINGRRIKIDEDGAGHIFASAGLGEESLVRTSVDLLLSFLSSDWAAVSTEAMLEQVP